MHPARIGKYAVIRKIASGGMAEIYLCRLRGEEGFQKKVAVKVIHPRLSETPRFRDLFAREARIAASLSHPNLIQVFDFGKEGQSLFLAMEFIDGWNLAHAVSRSRLRNVPFPLPVWRYWMEGILAALGYLHKRGIVHRDVSPSNVLLSRGGAVKIADFGISRAAFGGADPSAGWEGKFSYMSPEQARGEDADESSDLFAAAAIAAELYLPGRIIDGDSPEHILSIMRQYDVRSLDLGCLPSGIADVVRKGLSTSKEDRYADADAFGRAVCNAVTSAAGRSELESCWNGLFPEEPGEEDTVVAAPAQDKDIAMVRERRSAYGKKSMRFLKTGIAAAVAAVSVGGWLALKEAGRPHTHGGQRQEVASPASRNPDDAPPAAVLPAVPPAKKKPLAETAARDAISPSAPSGNVPAAPSATVQASRAPESPSREVLVETIPPGVVLTLDDGTPLGRTPLRLDPAPLKGRKIVFQKEGYDAISVHAEVLAGFRTTPFSLDMERQMGTVKFVQAIPWAKVFEGNRLLGFTPIYNLKLPVGSYRLRFVNEPLGIEHVQEVTVRRGSNDPLIVTLVGKRKTE
ncbi:MAG: protein kinase [Deltaproteobacteria bacterium]|nr:protein kinase [Deltaproteobacteria bacterium]